MTQDEAAAVMLQLGFTHEELGIVRPPPATRPVPVRPGLRPSEQVSGLARVQAEIDDWRRPRPVLVA